MSDFVKQYSSAGNDSTVDFDISSSSAGLQLVWQRQSSNDDAAKRRLELLRFVIDVDKLVKQQRSYPAPKQGAFNQALGKKTHHVVDATGGWGGDALLMCTQGYTVTILERNPIMALLLSDAMTRLATTSWAQDNSITPPKVINVDAIDALSEVANHADCVYLDPMFPSKKKKSAATNKYMQLLHFLVGEDVDSEHLLSAALASGAQRVAVKRPDYASPIADKPSVVFSSKLVHYDVYLNAPI